MDYNTFLDIIRESYEKLYNSSREEKDKASIIINCSDEQTLSIKAYHKIIIMLSAVQIKDRLSYTLPLFKLEHTYNRGITSENEAHEEACRLLLQNIMMCIADK